MVRVPFASALRVIPYERCPIPDFVSPEFYDRQTPEIKMTFLLLRELKLGDDSMYLPYIRSAFPMPCLGCNTS